MKKITIMIVDDERSAREELKMAVAEHPDLDMIAEARNAEQARELILQRKPDVIFLDIQMPGENGFELLASLHETPVVVFVTAFDDYAFQAFEVSALDYLVKPVREERFLRAIEKIRKEIASRKGPDHNQPADPVIFIKDGKHCHFITLSHISLIESIDNYSRIFFDGKQAIVKRSLNQWEQLLDAKLFFRANRQQLINTGFVKEIKRLASGKLRVSLLSNHIIEMSDRQSAKFRQYHIKMP